ncbi:MAG: methylated-DNA--[protein]-cysteine S-methyltransferase [Candidatus Marinimicrobia bacterium]|nr:methylated-DNA--[protein]-cysteine S-methyltransferase [Candidatus Neomarinimicrobiota bacterium]
MKTITFDTVKTPFGIMGLAASEKGLCRVYFPEDAPFDKSLQKEFPERTIVKNGHTLLNIKKQFKEYFSGKRKSFEIELDLNAPPFYSKVLTEVNKIPYGKTATYQDIAIRCGNPKAVRAAGSANANNPLPIVIPCHRILNTGGGLGGYGGKLERKVFLLELENSL